MAKRFGHASPFNLQDFSARILRQSIAWECPRIWNAYHQGICKPFPIISSPRNLPRSSKAHALDSGQGWRKISDHSVRRSSGLPGQSPVNAPKNWHGSPNIFNHDQASRKKLAKTPCILHEKSRKQAPRPGQASPGALTVFSQDSPKQTPKNVPRIPFPPHQGICNPCPQTLVKTSLAYHITSFRITQGSRPSVPPGPQDSGMLLHARGNSFSLHCKTSPGTPVTYPAITSREITGGMPGNPRQRISQDTQRTSEDHPGKFLAFHKKSIGKAKTMRHSRKHAPNSYPEQFPGNSGGKSGKSKLARPLRQ